MWLGFGGTNDATSRVGAAMGRLTFALMVVGTTMYLTGYFMIEDLLTFLNDRK
jgi:hypothetical protein